MFILALDTETNGLKADRNNAISIALVMANFVDGSHKKFKKFYSLIDWRKIDKYFDIPLETTEVHGINMADLNSAPGPLEAYANVYDEIQKFNQEEGHIDILNGWNVTFDLHMIIQDLIQIIKYYENKDRNEEQYIKVRKLLDFFYNQNSGEEGAIIAHDIVITSEPSDLKIIDSMLIDIQHEKTQYGMKIRHNLTSGAERLGLENPDAHNSLVDTEVTLDVLIQQIRKYGLTLDKNYEDELEQVYIQRESRFARANVKSYNGRDY